MSPLHDKRHVHRVPKRRHGPLDVEVFQLRFVPLHSSAACCVCVASRAWARVLRRVALGAAMFHIAAINDVDASRDFAEPLAPTKEAQESRLTQMYGEALSCLQHGQIEKSQSLFQSILQDPISIKAQVEPMSAMLQLRYSALKNLAETYSMQGSDHHGEAVYCVRQAAAIDGKDVVLWNRLGTLSCALGNLYVAR